MADQVIGVNGIVVADAGPLIHLDELDCLWLLQDFCEVKVPEAVWREVAHHRPLALQNPNIPLLRCTATPSEKVAALTPLYTLHAGEREALCLCVEFSGSLLLTDDTAARLAAKILVLEAHGTIGLLVRAIRRQQLTKSKVVDLLGAIPNRSSLHIRRTLLAEIIQKVADTV